MLEIKHLVKTFGSKKILDDVSLTVRQGEVAVLLGSSGVGKSTLLRLLANLETIDQGTVTFNQEPLDPKRLAKQHLVGMVFQQFNLFAHMTVQRNITFALEKVLHMPADKANEMALDLLKRYGLADKKNHYPAELSGGQKQRLAIARALAMKPQIICMDEPTSALDPLLTTYVANNIQDLAKEGYMVLVASHDTQLLEKIICTIYLMEQGKIVEVAASGAFWDNQDAYPRIKKFVAG